MGDIKIDLVLGMVSTKKIVEFSTMAGGWGLRWVDFPLRKDKTK